MVSARVQNCGGNCVDSGVKIEQSSHFISPPIWNRPVGFLDTNGGMPLEITYQIESENEEDERHCREALERRGDEPTLSTEEVERELKKDGLL